MAIYTIYKIVSFTDTTVSSPTRGLPDRELSLTEPVSLNFFIHFDMEFLFGDSFLYLVLNLLWTSVVDFSSANHRTQFTFSSSEPMGQQ